MEISFSEKFKKAYQKRVKGTASEITFRQSLEIFKTDPFNAKLKTHKLSGPLKGLWSFSVEYNIRIVFYFTDDKPQKAILVNIGHHDEEY